MFKATFYVTPCAHYLIYWGRMNHTLFSYVAVHISHLTLRLPCLYHYITPWHLKVVSHLPQRKIHCLCNRRPDRRGSCSIDYPLKFVLNLDLAKSHQDKNSNTFENVQRVRQWYCVVLHKISKRLDKSTGCCRRTRFREMWKYSKPASGNTSILHFAIW